MPDETYSKKIQGIVEGYGTRELKKYQRKGKNKAPEKDVEKELDAYWLAAGFFINRYESKAKNIGGVWRSSGLEFGTPDRLGCDRSGYFIAVEVKAKGKRSSLREEQRIFLIKIIERGGFGLCCDSLEYFKKHYKMWTGLSGKIRVDYLMALLPGAKVSKTVGSVLASASD